jgi:type III secretory pathway component EscS
MAGWLGGEIFRFSDMIFSRFGFLVK